MFIQTEATPNPASLKFLPGQAVVSDGPHDFRSLNEAGSSPLATRLFGIEGVAGVFLGGDFITITKGAAEWQYLKPAILGVIMEHYLSGEPAIHEHRIASDISEQSVAPADKEIVSTIKELLNTRVRPAVAQDGGDITFHGYKEGIVFLNMKGSCSGCPSSTATLKQGIENLLRHFIPEVKEVRPV